MVRLVLEQLPVVMQYLDDVGIRVEHQLAGEQRGRGEESTVAAHGIVDFQAIAAADVVVVQAMSGRGMHGAGAGIEVDMVAEDHRDFTVVERMPQPQMLELATPLAIALSVLPNWLDPLRIS